MALVRAYSRNPVKPAYTRRIPKVAALPTPKHRPKPSVIRPGAVVKGVALWDGRGSAALGPRRLPMVTFVDGELRWPRPRRAVRLRARPRLGHARRPERTAHAVGEGLGRRGYRMLRRYPVRVNNKPIELALEGVTPDAGARGDVTIGVSPSYPVTRLVLYVDGKPVSRDGSAPYRLRWDSTAAAEGPQSCSSTGAAPAAAAPPVWFRSWSPTQATCRPPSTSPSMLRSTP